MVLCESKKIPMWKPLAKQETIKHKKNPQFQMWKWEVKKLDHSEFWIIIKNNCWQMVILTVFFNLLGINFFPK